MEVEGFEDFAAAVRDLPDQVLDRFAVGVRSAAEATAADARHRAPSRAGELAASIRVQPAQRGRTRVSAGVVVEAPHAAAQEYGTTELPAQPFLRPAADGVGRAVVAAAADRALDAAARGSGLG